LVNAPALSTVGFDNMGGQNPLQFKPPPQQDRGVDVDQIMAQMFGPTAGLGSPQQPQMAPPPVQAGLGGSGGATRLAAGGLAKPVLSTSSMNTAQKQSHFGGLNVKAATPKGGHLGAINVPAVRSPGAHLINSAVPGRVDRIPMRARTGSFVLPADVVSGLGQGNTMAGAKMWGDVFTHAVGGGGGIKRAGAPQGRINPMGKARSIAGPIPRPPPAPKPMKTFAEGGEIDTGEVDDGTTPIITAGGEMLIDPEIVTALGGGDPEEGVRILHDSIAAVRKQVQAYQRNLPTPSS
jgi:hypothetical protein